jgi:formylmethanofuran dehydrogenase subunit E
MEINELMKKASVFHGHLCPGVAIGTLAAKYALDNGFQFSPNEEVVAVVENNNCSVDAIQVILGCTFGKGNLIFHDYGKNTYTFYNRKTLKAVRLAYHNPIKGKKKLTKEEKIQMLLQKKPEEVFEIKIVDFNPPSFAQIEDSIPCHICKEETMSSRLMDYQGSKMCIDCYKKMKK